jgi:hypothetical protein
MDMTDRAQALLKTVCRALDMLIQSARPYHGLFPSMLQRRTGEMLMEPPPGIPGQRVHDRSIRGSNLCHDEPTLMTMLALGAVDKRYPEAAGVYLRRFATHCAQTRSGLFPWGEHSHWDLVHDKVGNSYEESGVRIVGATHDHLRAAPLWLLEELTRYEPSCVHRFALGLAGHWILPRGVMGLEYTRHAYIEEMGPYQGGHQQVAVDFPRHGGFYIFDWSYSYSLTGEKLVLEHIQTMLDYWWGKKSSQGLAYMQSRAYPEHSMAGSIGVAQTLSLAVSLLESAKLLEVCKPELAKVMRERAGVYIDGFFAAPHDPAKHVYMLQWNVEVPSRTMLSPIWGSKYGHTPASYTGGMLLAGYRQTGDARVLDLARSIGQGYAMLPFPGDATVPGMDAGMGLGLLADLYDVTREARWLEAGFDLAGQMQRFYFDDAPLPRGASGIDWYESQMGPGFLLHGMARLALLEANADACPLGPDYTGR